MRITLLLILCLLFRSVYSQDPQSEYSRLLEQFNSQNYKETFEAGNAYLKSAGEKDSNYANVLSVLQYCCYFLQNYEKGIEFANEERTVRLTLSNSYDEYYINATYNLAVLHSYLKQYGQATGYINECASLALKKYGSDNITYIEFLKEKANINNLAGIYYEAELCYDTLLAAIKRNFNENDSIYKSYINIIASFYLSNGNYEKAEPFYTGAVELMGKYYGKPSNEYMLSLNSLGEFYIYGGMYGKAENVFAGFVELCKEFYGKTSADYATALNNLAVSYEKQNKNDEAEKTYLECLKIKEKVFRKESDYYALTLNNLAVLYDNMGRYDNAGKLLDQSLQIYSQVYGGEHINYAIALNSMASVYSASGKYVKAIELLDKALEIQLKQYGENYDACANTVNSLGNLYQQTGKYKMAEEMFARSAGIRKKILGEKHKDYGTSLMGLAQIKTELGKYTEADSLLKVALEIQFLNGGETNPQYVNTLNSLAGLCFSMGNYILSEEYYRKCEVLYRKIYGEFHPEYAVFLNNYGLFLTARGDYPNAEKTLNRSLQINRNSFGAGHPDNVNMMVNLAQLMIEKGDFRSAESFILESLNIIKEKLGTEHPSYSNTLLSLGVLYYETGNYEKAGKSYNTAAEKIKTIYGENSTNYASVMNNIGTLYLAEAVSAENISERNKFAAKAEDYIKKAIFCDSVANGVENAGFSTYLNNLAELYRNTQQFSKAENLLKRTIALERKHLGDNNAKLAVTYHNLSLLYEGAAMHDSAELYCSRALSIKQNVFGKSNPECSGTLASLARIYENKGEVLKSFELYKEALDMNYRLIRKNFSFLSEEEKAGYLKTLSVYENMFYTFALRNRKASPEITCQAYNNALTSKGILLRSSEEIRNHINSTKNKELRDIYMQLAGIKQQLAKLYSAPLSGRYADTEILEEEANSLEKRLVTEASDKGNTGIFDLTWQEVRKKLGMNDAAVEFVHFPAGDSSGGYADVYCALLLRKDYPAPEFIELTGQEAMEKILSVNTTGNAEYINTVYGNSNAGKPALYDLIWKPLEGYLNNVNNIYISPSGILNKVAFQALTDNSGSKLCDLYNVMHVSSTFKSGEVSGFNFDKNCNVVILGGIEYNTDSAGVEVWKYLKGTETEAENIRKIVAADGIKTEYFCGKQASEANFKTIAPKSSLIHIATHGFFYPDPDEVKSLLSQVTQSEDVAFRGSGSTKQAEMFTGSRNPLMRSGLVLAFANSAWNGVVTEDEDGILTAYEVSNMNLAEAQLVVLSACETGLGDIRGSEGVYGLQRAFKMAGVKYIIMSLWQVPDKETVEFMEMFYKKLLKSMDVRRSFNETQKEMRKKYNPYYWGAFVLVE